MTITVPTPIVDPALTCAFADLLDYPSGPISEAAGACEELARAVSDEAGGLVGRLAAFAGTSSLGELQEAYTAAFDLDSMSQATPTCYPYVGHHLFDENHKRSAFILGLRKRYRLHGFDEPAELPDHLVVLLRFLTVCGDAELAAELVDDALIPGIARMLASVPDGLPDGRSAYCDTVRALGLVLAACRPERIVDERAELEAQHWQRPGDSLGIERDGCNH